MLPGLSTPPCMWEQAPAECSQTAHPLTTSTGKPNNRSLMSTSSTRRQHQGGVQFLGAVAWSRRQGRDSQHETHACPQPEHRICNWLQQRQTLAATLTARGEYVPAPTEITGVQVVSCDDKQASLQELHGKRPSLADCTISGVPSHASVTGGATVLYAHAAVDNLPQLVRSQDGTWSVISPAPLLCWMGLRVLSLDEILQSGMWRSPSGASSPARRKESGGCTHIHTPMRGVRLALMHRAGQGGPTQTAARTAQQHHSRCCHAPCPVAGCPAARPSNIRGTHNNHDIT